MPEKQGMFGDIIKQARNPETQFSSSTENQETIKPDNQEKEVNLSVKVPLSLRRHWAAEAKRQGITMTEVIIEALTKKFGEP